VGRHSDSIDVTGPIDMTGLDRGRRRNFTLFTLLAVAAALVVAAAAVALLLLAT
jgi:hypothetical protein